MRHVIRIALLVAITSSGAYAGPKEVHVNVKGMVCAFCSQGLTKKFKENAAVESVKVDLEKKDVGISLKEGKTISDEEITSIVKDSGFNVEKIAR